MKLAAVSILFALFIAATLIDADVQQTVNDVTTTKDGAVWCPVPLIGTSCPSSSVFHYYHCCGDFLKDCCFNLQVWVIVVLGVIAFIIIAGFVISIVRFVFCRRR